ncbi:MAG: DUF3891 family protein [Planctomycetaceae bacterium]
MIRRDDGNDWLLIPQIEHAHLAADIAARWGNDQVRPFPGSDELVEAIRHHDDGWAEWDAAPRINRANGIPRSFTEMPMCAATEIWTRSIAVCGDISPLNGTWVSKHFCWLAEQARESRIDKPDDLRAIEAFLDAQEQLHQRWKFASGDQLIDSGFHGVQFFDRLSLWLCCAPRTEPLDIDCPNFGRIRFTPLTDHRIVVAPDPFSARGQALELTVAAKQISARRYADDADLQSALHAAEIRRLTWTLSG